MSNGKDFYVELRKQVTALQQGSERAGTYCCISCLDFQDIPQVEGPSTLSQLSHSSKFGLEEEGADLVLS